MPTEAEIEAAMKSLLYDHTDLEVDDRGSYSPDRWRAAVRAALEAAERVRTASG